MSQTTLFDALYRRRKNELMHVLVERLLPMYSDREIGLLRIDAIDPQILAQRSGRGFVNRDLLETLLGNLLECAAPGSHNAVDLGHERGSFSEEIGNPFGVLTIRINLYEIFENVLVLAFCSIN